MTSESSIKTLPVIGRVFNLYSYAKLNLSLLVYKPNINGYHPICSVFQEISLFDTLTITLTSNKDCFLSCNIPSFPTNATNLLHQVYDQFKHRLYYGLNIHVHKQIPIGGGLGGGSSNACCLIQFLNQTFKLNYSQRHIKQVAKSLGADIPFFISGGTQLVRGIGENCTPLKTKSHQFYVIITPNTSISTQQIFNAYDKNHHLPAPRKTPNYIIKTYTGPNTLKTTVFNCYPSLRHIENKLNSLQTPPIHLSGTGSTLFFITSTWRDAILWESKLKPLFNNCFVKAVKPIKGRPS